MLNEKMKESFLSLLDRNGYVLNFTNKDFDDFTFVSVGFKVQQKYALSKGKSLKAFLNDDNISDVLKIKLLTELFSFYEKHYEFEYKQEDGNELNEIEVRNKNATAYCIMNANKCFQILMELIM